MSADTAFNATMRSIFLLSTALPGRDVSGGGVSAARFVSEDGKIKLFFPPPPFFSAVLVYLQLFLSLGNPVGFP